MSLSLPLSLSRWTHAHSPSYLADVWVPPPPHPISDSCFVSFSWHFSQHKPGGNQKGEEKKKKVAATGRTTTMTRSWLKLNGLANLFWALMRLETWVATAWYLSLSFSGDIFPVSSPPDVEMAFLTGDNNRHLNARSPVPLLWRADS